MHAKRNQPQLLVVFAWHGTVREARDSEGSTWESVPHTQYYSPMAPYGLRTVFVGGCNLIFGT